MTFSGRRRSPRPPARHGCAARHRCGARRRGSWRCGRAGGHPPWPGPTAAGPARHGSRWRRRPADDTWWRSERSSGWLSRTRRPGRDRAGLPSEPGRGFCQDLPFLAQPTVLTLEPTELVALGADQFDHLLAELRRIGRTCSWHRGLVSSQLFRCPRNWVNPRGAGRHGLRRQHRIFGAQRRWMALSAATDMLPVMRQGLSRIRLSPCFSWLRGPETTES